MQDIQLMSAANAGANATSVPSTLGDLKDFSIHIDFSSGTLNGTLTLECSNDGSDWVTVSGSTQSVASGASHMWNISNACYRYVRVAWAWTSGTGTLTARMVIKENVVKGA